MESEATAASLLKTEISLPVEDDLEFLIKLQRKWEEITKTRKAGKTFFSGSLYLFIQNFPDGYRKFEEISSQMQMLSSRTVEKHIECLTAVGILARGEGKKVALTLTGKKVAEVLHRYDQNVLEEQLLIDLKK